MKLASSLKEFLWRHDGETVIEFGPKPVPVSEEAIAHALSIFGGLITVTEIDGTPINPVAAVVPAPAAVEQTAPVTPAEPVVPASSDVTTDPIIDDATAPQPAAQ